MELIQKITYLMRNIDAALNVVRATKNPWALLLLALASREVQVKIKSKPEVLTVRISLGNYKVLYYLSLLRNRGLVFNGEKITISPCSINLLPEKITKEELAVICTALRHGLTLNEYDNDHFLVRLKENLSLIIRRNSIVDIAEVIGTFVKNRYRQFYHDLKGKVVLDVGGFIGDTAICFHMDGARMVYVYEPTPIYYDLAIKNIKLNKLDNVKLFNIGVGATRGKFVTGEITVDIIPLSETIEQIGDVDLLKMDCEGCEFPALLSLNHEHFHKIKEIIIEYHKDPYPLVRRLQKTGFMVDVKKPSTHFQRNPIGFLYAKKEGS